MRRLASRLALTLVVAALPIAAQAQVRPIPGAYDARIQTVVWHRDEVVKLRVAWASPVTIEFGGTGAADGSGGGASEHIANVTLGDSHAWQVAVARDGASLTVRPQAGGTPAGMSTSMPTSMPTSMIVRTDTRTYAFDLETGDGVTAMLVRFVYPEDHRMGSAPQTPQFASQGQFAPQAQFQGGPFPQLPPPGGMATAAERYRLKGDKALRPDWIADDGQRMFLRWSEDKPMPAVFAVDETGREMTVDGFMRNGAYTIDRVWPQLVFRIDRHMASATRLPPAKVGKDKVRKDRDTSKRDQPSPSAGQGTRHGQ